MWVLIRFNRYHAPLFADPDPFQSVGRYLRYRRYHTAIRRSGSASIGTGFPHRYSQVRILAILIIILPAPKSEVNSGFKILPTSKHYFTEIVTQDLWPRGFSWNNFFWSNHGSVSTNSLILFIIFAKLFEFAVNSSVVDGVSTLPGRKRRGIDF